MVFRTYLARPLMNSTTYPHAPKTNLLSLSHHPLRRSDNDSVPLACAVCSFCMVSSTANSLIAISTFTYLSPSPHRPHSIHVSMLVRCQLIIFKPSLPCLRVTTPPRPRPFYASGFMTHASAMTPLRLGPHACFIQISLFVTYNYQSQLWVATTKWARKLPS
jgi:hypothetical protein